MSKTKLVVDLTDAKSLIELNNLTFDLLVDIINKAALEERKTGIILITKDQLQEIIDNIDKYK